MPRTRAAASRRRRTGPRRGAHAREGARRARRARCEASCVRGGSVNGAASASSSYPRQNPKRCVVPRAEDVVPFSVVSNVRFLGRCAHTSARVWLARRGQGWRHGRPRARRAPRARARGAPGGGARVRLRPPARRAARANREGARRGRSRQEPAMLDAGVRARAPDVLLRARGRRHRAVARAHVPRRRDRARLAVTPGVHPSRARREGHSVAPHRAGARAVHARHARDGRRGRLDPGLGPAESGLLGRAAAAFA